jgi:hypothetical protein
MEEQTNTTNWLEAESENLNQNSDFGEKLPAFKFLEENKVYEFDVDFSKPFSKWIEEKNGKSVIKAIIPITYEGNKMVFWLNKKNPAYAIIVNAGKANQTHFKFMRTGSQDATKYVLVK